MLTFVYNKFQGRENIKNWLSAKCTRTLRVLQKFVGNLCCGNEDVVDGAWDLGPIDCVAKITSHSTNEVVIMYACKLQYTNSNTVINDENTKQKKILTFFQNELEDACAL